MGAGGKKASMPEIEETRASIKDDKFQDIVDRIKSVAEDFEEEKFPLYMEIGQEEHEVGYQRVVKFNISKFDFKLTRSVEELRVSGEGIHKHLEQNKTPKVSIKLRRKSQYESDWQVVDLEDLF